MFISPRAPFPTPTARGAVIVGGGPAGTALLLAASREGRLETLVDEGLVVVERGDRLGAGEIGGYAVVSDSTADTFLSGVRGHPSPRIARLIDRPEARALAAHGGGEGVPLAEVGAFLAILGAELSDMVRDHGGAILTKHEALGAARTPDGWSLNLRRLADGAMLSLPARGLVIATGGVQSPDRLGASMLAGDTLAARCGERLVRSHDVLSHGGLERLARRLGAARPPRIAIVGSSTSAVTAASLILRSPLGARLADGGLALLHRRKLRPFYPSAAAAEADGYADFGPDDVCPLSGFVYRLAGFRTEARDLVLSALGIGGRRPDPRLALHCMTPANERRSLRLLAEADVVIGALGYRPRMLPLHDAAGLPITLAAAGEAAAPMVDDQSRVLDESGAPLPMLFGMGLAAGFTPSGPLGGEPSFRGQANGLWLWQNAVGAAIVARLLPDRAERIRQLSRLADPRQSRAA